MRNVRNRIALGLAALLFAACVERPGGTLPGPARSDVVASSGARSDSLRDAVARELAKVTESARQGEDGPLAEAQALAQQYAAEFGDSLLLRRVARFGRSSARTRNDMATADRLWRAGRETFGSEGVPAAMRLWRASLRHAAVAGDTVMQATVLNAIGAGFFTTGALDSAGHYLQSSYRLAERAGDYRTMGNALGNLASVSMGLGDFAGAAERYRRASTLRLRTGDTRGLAADENYLGLIAWELGDLEHAAVAFRRALELNRREGRDRSAALNLSNLGKLATLQGDYENAEELYREALALNAAAADSAELAYVLADVGLLAARRGDLSRAAASLQRALALHESAGASSEAIAVRSHLASVWSAAGDLERALGAVRRAERDAAATHAGPDVAGSLALAHAEVSLQLGRIPDAERRYEAAAHHYEGAGDAAGAAEAELGRAVLRLMREDHPGALELFRAAARRQRAAGDRRAAALTQLHVGAVQRETGDTAAARRTLSAALDTLVMLGDPVGQALALGALAELALDRGAALASEALYYRALEAIGDRELPHVTWRLHAGLAETLRRRGALDAAAEQLRTSLESIERLAAGIRLPERRDGFLADKWDVYTRLAELEAGRGRNAAAFEVSERLRARRLLEALSQGRIPARTRESVREQDLRRRISDLSRVLAADVDPLRARRDPATSETGAPVIEALAAAQREYAELLLELRESDAAHARRVATPPSSWEAVARRLPPGTVLLQYQVGESAVLAFAVTRDTVRTLDLRISPRELRHLGDFARMALQSPDTGANALWRAPLRRLYAELIGPVEEEGLLEAARSLVIVPHRELNFLPFGALLAPGTGDRFLVERFDIAYAPSASAWLELGARAKPAALRRVLALAPHPERLPASVEEVAAIRKTFGRRATLRSGAAATERVLREQTRRYDILHLATFGILNRHNPLFSHVELAPGGRDDGQLQVHEVYALALTGQLVVLSACQTALASGAYADIAAGDDWVGLVQAFLEAGASGVLAAQWPIEDRATALLMSRFYHDLGKGRSPPIALASAQRVMLRDPATAHPFYWAGFIMSGVSRN